MIRTPLQELRHNLRDPFTRNLVLAFVATLIAGIGLIAWAIAGG